MSTQPDLCLPTVPEGLPSGIPTPSLNDANPTLGDVNPTLVERKPCKGLMKPCKLGCKICVPDRLKDPTPASRDYTGNSKTVFSIIGASNHCAGERQSEDFYATPPHAVGMLLNLEPFSHRIWEPACGQGHISKVLEAHGHEVVSTDLIDRGYGIGGVDFLSLRPDANDIGVLGIAPSVPVTLPFDGDCITNPPYKYAQEFVETALDLVAEGHKVAMFLKLTFLEGKSRRALFDRGCLENVYVSSSRLSCGKNGTEFGPSAIAYAWFIFRRGFRGVPAIKWFN